MQNEVFNKARWPKERVKNWYKQFKWPVGCNFYPSSAINQLEMWQKDTFDPEILRENAENFSKVRFQNEFRAFVEKKMEEFNSSHFIKL